MLVLTFSRNCQMIAFIVFLLCEAEPNAAAGFWPLTLAAFGTLSAAITTMWLNHRQDQKRTQEKLDECEEDRAKLWEDRAKLWEELAGLKLKVEK